MLLQMVDTAEVALLFLLEESQLSLDLTLMLADLVVDLVDAVCVAKFCLLELLLDLAICLPQIIVFSLKFCDSANVVFDLVFELIHNFGHLA